MAVQIGRIERNDYRIKCPTCGFLMHFLEEIDDIIAAYYCDFCKQVRPGGWRS